MSCSKVLFIKMIQPKVLQILSKNTIEQRMVTETINFCKFIFLRGWLPLENVPYLIPWNEDSFAAGFLSLRICA